MWQIRSRTQPAGHAGPTQRRRPAAAEGIAARPGETRVHVDDPMGRDTLSGAIASHLAFSLPGRRRSPSSASEATARRATPSAPWSARNSAGSAPGADRPRHA